MAGTRRRGPSRQVSPHGGLDRQRDDHLGWYTRCERAVFKYRRSLQSGQQYLDDDEYRRRTQAPHLAQRGVDGQRDDCRLVSAFPSRSLLRSPLSPTKPKTPHTPPTRSTSSVHTIQQLHEIHLPFHSCYFLRRAYFSIGGPRAFRPSGAR